MNGTITPAASSHIRQSAPSRSGIAGTVALAAGYHVRRKPNGVTFDRQRRAVAPPPPVSGRGLQGLRGIRRGSCAGVAVLISEGGEFCSIGGNNRKFQVVAAAIVLAESFQQRSGPIRSFNAERISTGRQFGRAIMRAAAK